MVAARKVDRSEFVKLSQQLELERAERAADLLALEQLVRAVERVGGYMAPEHRRALDLARARLVESGR